MMMQQTHTQLRALKLEGFADARNERLAQPRTKSLSLGERISLLVERETHWRGERRRARLLENARLKYPQAAFEDLDTRSGRDIDSRALTGLAVADWVESESGSLLITGATGAGKSWLACTLAQYACRRGHSALYLRVPRLPEELRILHDNGGFTDWPLQVARVDVLLLDDWGMTPLDAMVRNDLPEMIDDRAAGKATIVTGQLPIEHLLSRSIVLHRVAVLEGNALQQQLESLGAVDAPPGFFGFLDQLECQTQEGRTRYADVCA